jgi:hypothetical protein
VLVLATADDDPAAVQAWWLRSMNAETRHALYRNSPMPTRPASRDCITEFMKPDGFPAEILMDR